ncbi:MAG: DNA-processing protein DprA, partial [Syntrophomonadaceae bacterium]|nr:DNA-processing protein DprA [Syntrophomonadaceae bacterium]
VGIVGSRDADESAISFTQQLARACVRDGFNVVSGGARGVDSVAQETALVEGGQVTSVLSNGLATAIRNKANREAILKKQLLLVSPYHPQARFSVGAAMGRNKLIYALSQFAVVISAAEGKGGTWSGATENIKHNWVSLFVRYAENIPDGNRALIRQGVHGLDIDSINERYGLSNILSGIDQEANNSTSIDNNNFIQDQEKSKTIQGSIAEGESTEYPGINDLFEVVWPYIQNILVSVNESNSKTLATCLNVNDKQMKDWLERATDEGRLEKLSRPVRYRLINSPQPLLFEQFDNN